MLNIGRRDNILYNEMTHLKQALDELDAGICEGLTYEDIETR